MRKWRGICFDGPLQGQIMTMNAYALIAPCDEREVVYGAALPNPGYPELRTVTYEHGGFRGHAGKHDLWVCKRNRFGDAQEMDAMTDKLRHALNILYDTRFTYGGPSLEQEQDTIRGVLLKDIERQREPEFDIYTYIDRRMRQISERLTHGFIWGDAHLNCAPDADCECRQPVEPARCRSSWEPWPEGNGAPWSPQPSSYYDELPSEHATGTDSSTVEFALEKTEMCWRDGHGDRPSSEKSETGLCDECVQAMRAQHSTDDVKPKKRKTPFAM